MLTKEEYLSIIEDFEGIFFEMEIVYNFQDIQKLKDLIKEHFELLEVLKDCGWGELTPKGLKVVIEAGQYSAKKLNELRNPQPYKFEDLKSNMWMWDDKEKICICIEYILSKKECEYLYHDENKKVFMTFHAIEFEENRFFPVTKALEYQGVKDDEKEI